MTTFKTIAIDSPITAYGELSTTNKEPFIQGNGIYGFIPSNFRTFTDGSSGTATVNDRVFEVTTGTSVGGYGTIRSFRVLSVKEGTGALVRVPALFTTGVASSIQGAGAFNIGDGTWFGYNGTEFGVTHRYGGVPECQELQVTTAATGSENATVTIDGTGYTVPLTATGSVEGTAYEIWDYLDSNLSGWNVEVTDDTVQIIATVDGDKTGSFAFSSATAVASWSEIRAGVTKTEDFTAQADFNGQLFSGFDPTKVNVYQIQYQYGYGDIVFEIENPDTGRFEIAHRIKWANNKTVQNFCNPQMKCGIFAASLGSTTDLTVKAPYISGFVQALDKRTRNPRSYQRTETSVSNSVYQNIFQLRNRQAYNGYNNQVSIFLDSLTVSTDSNKGMVVEIRANATVGGTPDFQDIGTNLVSQIDTAGTTATQNGRLLFSTTITGAEFIDLSPYKINIPPTLRVVVLAKTVSGTASDVNITLSWYEDV